MIEIKHWETQEVLFRSSCSTLKDAVCEAPSPTLWNANLAYADLSGIDCVNLDLSYAELTGADFTRANLPEVNFHNAVIKEANFYHANLRFATLSGADLRYSNFDYAELTGAIFTDAIIEWESPEILTEILRLKARGNMRRLKTAGVWLLQRWSLTRFLEFDDPETDWVVEVLSAYVKNRDYSPEAVSIRNRAAMKRVLCGENNSG